MLAGIMGTYPRWFPFPLTILTATVTWGVAVLLHQLDPSFAILVAVILIILATFVMIVVIKFIVHVLTKNIPGQTKIYGFIDGYFSLLHIFSGIAMAIIVLTDPIGQYFDGIPPGAKGYDLFWTYAFSNMVLTFNTVGLGNMNSKSALGVFPIVLSSIVGTIYLTVVLSVLVSHLVNPNTKETHQPDQRRAKYNRTQNPGHKKQYGYGPSQNGRKLGYNK